MVYGWGAVTGAFSPGVSLSRCNCGVVVRGNVGDVGGASRSNSLFKAAAFSCLSLKIDLEIPQEGRHRSAADCGQGENSQTSPSQIKARYPHN